MSYLGSPYSNSFNQDFDYDDDNFDDEDDRENEDPHDESDEGECFFFRFWRIKPYWTIKNYIQGQCGISILGVPHKVHQPLLGTRFTKYHFLVIVKITSFYIAQQLRKKNVYCYKSC